MNQASATPSPVRFIRFGLFEADLHAGELRKNGLKIKLQDQPFRVLSLLLERAGDVVTREEFREKLWSADTFVDFDHGLNAAVKKVRHALADSAENPRFVGTVARRGYRFIAPVNGTGAAFPLERASHANGALPTSQEPAASPPHLAGELTRPQKLPLQARRWIGLAAVLFFAIVGTAWLWQWSHRSGSSNLPPMKVSRLTSFPGIERDAVLSPDGKQLAFAWNSEDTENFDIYIQLVDTGKPVRLTAGPANDFCPVWSPDGRYIAFARSSTDDSGFYLVPFMGGQERKLADAAFFWPRFFRTLDWSPDGKLMAVADRASSEDPFSIFLITVETGARRKLTSPLLSTSPSLEGDSCPVFSPDGRSLAFARGSGSTFRDILIVPTEGGEPRKLISGRLTYGLDWTSDGREIVFSSAVGAGARRRLWRTPASRASAELIDVGGEFALNPTVSAQGNDLIYTEWINSSAIWQIDLADSKSVSSQPLISSTQVENSPQVSPSGKKLVFASTRTGSYEIWTCDSDGGNPQRLTFFGGPLTGTPRWSPDGRQIAFDSRPAGYSDIFLISSVGGSPKCLTLGSSAEDDIAPSWSRDGRWIYFTSDRSGRSQIWKMPTGGGPAVPVTKNGGFEAFESADGSTIYFSRQDPVGLWKVPVEGGNETPVLQEKMLLRSWVLAKEGIYFAAEGDPHGTRIKYFSFSTRAVTQVAALERGPVRSYPALAISPDGSRLLCALSEPDRFDTMLVENFR